MVSLPWSKRLTLVLAAFTAAVATAQDAPQPVMTLAVDETQAARRIAFVHEEILTQPGTLCLAYPRWIPGEHGATGPIQQLADLRIHSGNETLAWIRDPDDVFTFHVQILPNVTRISIDFTTLLENTISDHQLLLAWNTVILYPRGLDKQTQLVESSLVLPPKWLFASSLRTTGQSNGRVSFAPVSLERLIDSPVLAGEFLRMVPLKAGWPAELDITADSQSALDKSDDLHAFEMFGNMIDQDRAMFGFRHWEKMRILISESEARSFDGLEHEDSPYNGIGDAGLAKRDQLDKFGAWLLTHEQSHSWDGKYRRPAELYSKQDYQGPERNSLLWVYEGLNQYIGMLLAARAGFEDAGLARESFAWIAADQSLRRGRSSSPLVDTAILEPLLRGVDVGWTSLRRSEDFYVEGALTWLLVDTIIRGRSQGRVTLDDFLRSFFGQQDTGPIVVPYTREDLEGALSAVSQYDWHAFFEAQIYQVNSKPPTDGLEAAGWRLVFTDQPNSFYLTWFPDACDASQSIGIDVKKDGTIDDVWPGKPAYDAGLGPHMTVLAVDGNIYSSDALNAALAHPKNGKITLIIRNFDSVETREIPYTGGVRSPHLERIPGTHDYLSEMLQARKVRP